MLRYKQYLDDKMRGEGSCMKEKGITQHGDQQQESRAIYSGLGAAAAAFILSYLTFGEQTALYGRGSVGFRTALFVAAATFVLFYSVRYRATAAVFASATAKWQRFGIIAERLSLAAVYAIVGFLVTIGTFYVISNGFLGLSLDPFSSALIVALFVGVTSYVVYLLARSLSTVQLSGVLGVFLVSGALASMMTASDPQWWERHFSALGAGGGVSGYAFNGTLILAGLAIAALAGFISNDFATIQQRDKRYKVVKVRIIRTALVLIGIFLACVGLFVYDAYPLIHNSSAGGMAIIFIILVLGLPWIAPTFSRAFFLFSYLLMVSLVVSFWLFNAVGYFNLTVFELIAVAVIFGWLIVFIRQIAATRQ